METQRSEHASRFQLRLVVLIAIVSTISTLSAISTSFAQDDDNTAFGAGALTSPSSAKLADSAFGFMALGSPTSGTNNTAVGTRALLNNTTGFNETACGAFALEKNTTGVGNTAIGTTALLNNTTGFDNTAVGNKALFSNLNGSHNTASGFNALGSNVSGIENTAYGYAALASSKTASVNTAVGFHSLNRNTTGAGNTASGYRALQNNTTGKSETADGRSALLSNTTGDNNTAVGMGALSNNTTGNSNIALGINAGVKLTTGSNNIDIGEAGVKDESKTIRIGLQGTQTATYLAGVSGELVADGITVVVNSSGRLGVLPSSVRYKHDIRDMGAASSDLMKLRPVSFRYNQDSTGTVQYGLIAEEVEKLYPELVTHGSDGKIEAVRYSTLTSMLLNELQKQNAQISQLSGQLAEAKATTQRQAREMAALQTSVAHRLAVLEQTVAARHKERTLAFK